MLQSRPLATILALFALLPFTARAVVGAEKPDLTNIGFVFYSKSLAPGALNARWLYTDAYRGPGIATGGPVEGFAGSYHVRYFLDSGDFSDEYELVIEKTGDAYRAYWLVDGKTLAIGVGMEVGGGLAVGWRRVSE